MFPPQILLRTPIKYVLMPHVKLGKLSPRDIEALARDHMAVSAEPGSDHLTRDQLVTVRP